MRAMVFEPSAKAVDIRQRLQAFMDEHVYPNEPTFRRQIDERRPLAADADRRRVESKSARRRIVEPVPAGQRVTAPDSPTSNTRRSARSWGARRWRPRSSTARRPTRATWKCSCATARRAERSMARAAAGRRDPLLLRDDRARRRVVRRDQHPVDASTATATATSSTAANGGRRARAIRAAGSRSSWARPIPTRRAPPAAVDDPGAAGHAGRHDRAHAAGVRLRRCAARARGDRRSRTSACRRRTCCSAKAAASRSRRAGSAPAESTTACA